VSQPRSGRLAAGRGSEAAQQQGHLGGALGQGGQVRQHHRRPPIARHDHGRVDRAGVGGRQELHQPGARGAAVIGRQLPPPVHRVEQLADRGDRCFVASDRPDTGAQHACNHPQ